MVEGWINTTLDQLCFKITDGTHKTPIYQNEGIVFLSAKNVKAGLLDLSEHKFISKEEHIQLTKRCKPESGDVMLSKSGSLGDAIVIPDLPFEFSIFESLALLKTKRNHIDSEFLKQYLNSPISHEYFRLITSGVAVKHLHLVDLRKILIMVPPLIEQKKIAKILRTWDDAIEKVEKLIKLKKRRVQYIWASLINKAGHERKPISSIATEMSNRNKNGAVSRVLSVTNKNGLVLPEEQFQRRVASEDVSNYKIVQKGEYAYNPSRINVGSIARLDIHDEGILSPMYVTFALDLKNINSDYFLIWLSSSEARQRIVRSAQGSVRDSVGFSDLSSIKIPLPNLEKQNKIVDVLNVLKSEIYCLQNKVEVLKSQKHGLMQKLLTGQWRVNTDEVEAGYGANHRN